MEREKSSMFLGLGLLAGGIVVLLFVLGSVIALAASPGPFLSRQLGTGTQNTPPAAVFAWSSDGTSANFQDLSSSGSSAIASYAWTFGDGANSTERNPSHTYATNGSYMVTLTVLDENGLQASAGARVDVQITGGNGGRSESSPNFNLDIGTAVLPVAIAILTFGMYVVGFLVGGSLVKAGWNLVRPRPETIRLRLNPRNWEAGATAEAVAPTPIADAPVPPPPPA
jgi:hypothetical protein